MKRNPTSTDTRFDFGSVREMIDYAQSPVSNGDYWEDKARASQRDNGNTYLEGKFYSSDTFDEAAETLRSGSWNIDRLVNPILDRVSASIGTVERKRMRLVNSVSGGTANIGRLVAGDPRCARRAVIEKSPRYGRHVTIMTNLTAAWSVKPEQIARRGAALVALVESLNLAGIGVDVFAAICVAGSMSDGRSASLAMVTHVVVSKAGAYRVTTTYTIGNGDFFRRFMFSVMEHMTPNECKRFGVPGSYG